MTLFYVSCVVVMLCIVIAFLVTEIWCRGSEVELLEFELKQVRSILSTQTRQVNDAAHLVGKLKKLLNDTAMRLNMKWQNSITLRRDGRDFLIGELYQLEVLESMLKEFCYEYLWAEGLCWEDEGYVSPSELNRVEGLE